MLLRIFLLATFFPSIAIAVTIKDGMPAHERVNLLRQYFDPAPETKAYIDFKSKRNKGRDFKKARGYIVVSPPKGRCFNVLTHKSKNELHICKPQKVPFEVRYLDKDGSFTWTIKTSDTDFGSRLTWQTDYRYGRYVTNREKWKGPSHAVLITGCKSKDISSAKMVSVSTAAKGTWTITIPKDLKPAELQCETADDNDDGEDLYDIDDIKDKVEIRTSTEDRCINRWQTNHIGAFDLPGSSFTKELGAPNQKGSCRFAYQGFRDDKKVALIECLKVTGFKWVYLPLACVKK